MVSSSKQEVVILRENNFNATAKFWATAYSFINFSKANFRTHRYDAARVLITSQTKSDLTARTDDVIISQ